MVRRASAVKWLPVIQDRISVALDRAMSGPQVHRVVADAARAYRDQAIAQGRTMGSVSTTYVNGVQGAQEESLDLNGGVIRYVFTEIAQAANWAISECRKRSPVGKGNYRDSWFVLVNGKLWPAAPATIPAGSEVWIVNTTPYSRKIETGGQRVSVPPGIVEAVRQATQRRFRSVQAQKAFKALQGGSDARGDPVPYVLKAAGVASGISFDKKTKKWGRKHAAYVSRRADRQAGQQLLYPTLILTEKRS